MTDQKKPDPMDRLTTRRQKEYVKNRVMGMSKRQAALKAGYSQKSANNAKGNIERGRVREVFAELVRDNIPGELIAGVIREGLEANETKVFNAEGGLIYSKPLINWSERRQYAELAARFGGYYVDKHEVELAEQTDDLPEEQVIAKAEALLKVLKGAK